MAYVKRDESTNTRIDDKRWVVDSLLSLIRKLTNFAMRSPKFCGVAFYLRWDPSSVLNRRGSDAEVEDADEVDGEWNVSRRGSLPRLAHQSPSSARGSRAQAIGCRQGENRRENRMVPYSRENYHRTGISYASMPTL